MDDTVRRMRERVALHEDHVDFVRYGERRGRRARAHSSLFSALFLATHLYVYNLLQAASSDFPGSYAGYDDCWSLDGFKQVCGGF